MTSRFSSWLFSRSPRILLIALASIWIAQMAFWIIWEWQRESIPVTDLLRNSGSTQLVFSVEAPRLNGPPQPIPESPFLSGNSDVLNRYFDYANARSDALSAYSDPTSRFPNPAADPLEPSDVLTAVPEEDQATDFSNTLRYRGFLQTAQGVRIAFIEDLEPTAAHRLRVGDRFKDWTLQSIAHEAVVFVSDQAVALTILRQKPEALIAQNAIDSEPALVVPPVEPPVEAIPQSETNSIATPEEHQP